jgi:hypothetical protein
MLQPNQIFIHIPKTAGTTLNFAIFNQERPVLTDFNYRHIVGDTKMSNCSDIFNPLKNDKYLGCQIFMFLRDPLDRLISEYYFMKDRSDFISLLKPIPQNFSEYVMHRNTRNYVIAFLLGKRIYSDYKVTQEDYELVVNAIEKLDIKIGIYEHFSESLTYISNEFQLKLNKKIENKRVTIKRPQTNEIEAGLVEKVYTYNAFDKQLYDYAFEKFKNLNINVKQQFEFVGDPLAYALIYSKKYCLLEIFLKDKSFINQNLQFVNEFHRFIHDKNITDPSEFINCYSETFYNTIKEQTQSINFESWDEKMSKANSLQKIETLAKLIESKEFLYIKHKPLIFNPKLFSHQRKVNFLLKFFNEKFFN